MDLKIFMLTYLVNVYFIIINAASVLFIAGSPSSLMLEVRVMSFAHCVHDGHLPVRRAMLSDDSSCSVWVSAA